VQRGQNFGLHHPPKSSEARRRHLFGVSGQRPEQGAAATFFAQHKTWAQGPYPAQCSICYSHAAGELIRLSARLSLVFGYSVDSGVASSIDRVGSTVNMRVVAFICHCPARRDGHLLLFTCVCP
jgi:hypothetical protein